MAPIFHSLVTSRPYSLGLLRQGAPLGPEASYDAPERPKDRSMTAEQKKKISKSKKGSISKVSKEAYRRAAETTHLNSLIRGPRQYHKKNTQIP